MRYICENCGTSFYSQLDCSTHEEHCCKQKLQIKAIGMLDCDIYVSLYKDAIKIGRMIDLAPGKTMLMMSADEMKFETIHKSERGYLLYTTDISKEYEDKIIRKMIVKRMDSLKKEKQLIDKKINGLKDLLDEGFDGKVNVIKDLLIDEL